MKNLFEIEDIEQLVNRKFINNFQVVGYTTELLTAPGENYGSLMLQVEIKTKSDCNGVETEEILHLVAKMIPKTEWIKKMFNTAVTFKKEVAVYKTIIPILKSIQFEHGLTDIVDCTPQCYGARISLNPCAEEVDDDAIIMMENLKMSGYQTMGKMDGLDLESARLVIKELAIFHALPIAVKLKKPDVFKKHFLPHLNTYSLFTYFSEEVIEGMVDSIIKGASHNPKCTPLIPLLKRAIWKSVQRTIDRPQPKEPFATIVHNDMWTNNVMVKREAGKPVKCKIVDFQLIEYGSPAEDLVFLLFTSLKKEILDLNYDDLIKLYYQEFIRTLKELRCDLTEFTYEAFEDEIDTAARSLQLFHILFMLTPIYISKNNPKRAEELSEEDILTIKAESKEYDEKVQEIVLQYAKRNWF